MDIGYKFKDGSQWYECIGNEVTGPLCVHIEEPKNEKFICLTCGKECASAFGLQRHERNCKGGTK
jgi:hypothetical protein